MVRLGCRPPSLYRWDAPPAHPIQKPHGRRFLQIPHFRSLCIADASQRHSRMASRENPNGESYDGHCWRKRTYGLGGECRDRMVLRSDEGGLNALRSVLPNRGAGGDTCIISDACRYIRDLKRQIRELKATLAAEVEATEKPLAEEDVRPEVTVARRDGGIEIHVSCIQRCGMLHAIYHALERLGFQLMQATTSFPGDLLVLDVFGLMPVGVNLQIAKIMLMRTIHEVGKAKN